MSPNYQRQLDFVDAIVKTRTVYSLVQPETQGFVRFIDEVQNKQSFLFWSAAEPPLKLIDSHLQELILESLT